MSIRILTVGAGRRRREPPEREPCSLDDFGAALSGDWAATEGGANASGPGGTAGGTVTASTSASQLNLDITTTRSNGVAAATRAWSTFTSCAGGSYESQVFDVQTRFDFSATGTGVQLGWLAIYIERGITTRSYRVGRRNNGTFAAGFGSYPTITVDSTSGSGPYYRIVLDNPGLEVRLYEGADGSTWNLAQAYALSGTHQMVSVAFEITYSGNTAITSTVTGSLDADYLAVYVEP